MTSLQPRKPYTDEELRQLYPAGLKLQLVQVLMRHGERTPVSARFENAGLHPFWPYCSALKQFRAMVLRDDQDPGVRDVGVGGGAAASKPMSTFAWKRRLEQFGRADDSAELAAGAKGELDALCDLGMLTDPGRATTLRLGHRLRHLYVDRLGFLPPSIAAADVEPDGLFFLRTTPIPRALESLQQAFSGMYPETTASPSSSSTTTSPLPPITIVSRAPNDETLFPNDGNCRRFAELSRAFAQRAAERWNDTDELAYVTSKIGRWLPAESPRVAIDGKPRLSGIMDTINATLAHGPETRLPAPFYDERVRRNIEQAALEEWFAGYQESIEYRTLGIGGLLGDLVARMVARAEVSSSAGSSAKMFKFGLSGCHDTTLAAILTSLGHKMGTWPPFTSHIALEMFQKEENSKDTATATAKSPSGWFSLFSKPAPPIGRKPTPQLTEDEKKRMDGYYVRIRYNDEPVIIPSCRTAGNHLEGDESFCTLEAFKATVDKFTPRDWKQECRRNLRTPAIPDAPQPAGV